MAQQIVKDGLAGYGNQLDELAGNIEATLQRMDRTINTLVTEGMFGHKPEEFNEEFQSIRKNFNVYLEGMRTGAENIRITTANNQTIDR